MSDEIVKRLEQDVARLEGKVEVIPALQARIESMGREIGQLRADQGDAFRRVEKSIDALADDGKQGRRVQLGLAITIAGSSLMLVLGLLVAFGGGA